MAKRSPRAARTGSVDETAAAYTKLEKDLDTLPAELIGRVTTDIPAAVSLALGALPQIEGLRAEMSKLLKQPPSDEISRLRERALACLYAHLRHVPRTSKTHEADLEEARVLRERLLAAADAHVAFGQLDAAALATIREGQGHLDRAQDLIALSALFRASWATIGSATQVKEADLSRASALGVVLVAELGAKSLGTGSASGGKTWADRRARAFRLFMNDYEEIRRAVQYLRYHQGDGDAFAPSLHLRETRAATPASQDADGDAGGDTDADA